MQPAYVKRFEKLKLKGQISYVFGTALLVSALISFIQWVAGEALSWQGIGMYALVGGLIAWVDWLVLARRYRRLMATTTTNQQP